MFIQHSQDEKVSAGEGVLMHSDSRFAHHGGDLYLAFNFRHVTRLAGIFLRIVAVLPFEIRHLLREEAEEFTARAKRFGVQRMAGGAQGGVANMSGSSRAKATS